MIVEATTVTAAYKFCLKRTLKRIGTSVRRRQRPSRARSNGSSARVSDCLPRRLTRDESRPITTPDPRRFADARVVVASPSTDARRRSTTRVAADMRRDIPPPRAATAARDGETDERAPLLRRAESPNRRGWVFASSIGRSFGAMAMVMMMIALVTWSGALTPRPIARRRPDEGNVFKRGWKAVNKAANGLADWAAGSGDAAFEKMEGFSKNARKAAGTELTLAMQSAHGEIFKQFDSAAGWSDAAYAQVQAETQALAADIEKTAKMIAEFLMGLKCSIGANDLKDTLDGIVKAVSQNSLTTAYKMVTGDPKKFINNLDDLACQLMWDSNGMSAAAAVMENFITLVKKNCPLVIEGGTKPAFTFGFSPSADAVGMGGRSAGASAEIGIGINIEGQKFCYAGGCIYAGFTVDVATIGTEMSVALSGYKSMADVPGPSNMMAFGLGVNLPDNILPDIELDVTLITGGPKLSNIIGISKSFSLGQETSPVPVTGSFSKGTCLTEWCITYEGGSCKGEVNDNGGGRDFKCYISRHAEFSLGKAITGTTQTVQQRWEYYEPKSSSGQKMRDEIEAHNDVYPVYEGCMFSDADFTCIYNTYYKTTSSELDIINSVAKESCSGFTTAECAKNRLERQIEKRIRYAMDKFFHDDNGGWWNEPRSYALCGV